MPRLKSSTNARNKQQQHSTESALTTQRTPTTTETTKPKTTRKKRKSPAVPWKKPKDMPKRPLSAYNLFFKDERERLLQDKNSPGYGFANLAKSIAAKWKSLTTEKRAPYEGRALEEKEKYERAVAKWRQEQIEKKNRENNKARNTPAVVFETLPEEEEVEEALSRRRSLTPTESENDEKEAKKDDKNGEDSVVQNDVEKPPQKKDQEDDDDGDEKEATQDANHDNKYNNEEEPKRKVGCDGNEGKEEDTGSCNQAQVPNVEGLSVVARPDEKDGTSTCSNPSMRSVASVFSVTSLLSVPSVASVTSTDRPRLDSFSPMDHDAGQSCYPDQWFQSNDHRRHQETLFDRPTDISTSSNEDQSLVVKAVATTDEAVNSTPSGSNKKKEDKMDMDNSNGSRMTLDSMVSSITEPTTATTTPPIAKPNNLLVAGDMPNHQQLFHLSSAIERIQSELDELRRTRDRLTREEQLVLTAAAAAAPPYRAQAIPPSNARPDLYFSPRPVHHSRTLSFASVHVQQRSYPRARLRGSRQRGPASQHTMGQDPLQPLCQTLNDEDIDFLTSMSFN